MTRIFIAGAVLVDHLTCAFQKVLNLTKIKKVYWIAYFLCGNIMQFLRRPNRRSVDLIGLTILEYHIICFSIYTSLPFGLLYTKKIAVRTYGPRRMDD